MATEVQLPLSQSDRSNLDSVLRPHLRLEPLKQQTSTGDGDWGIKSPERVSDPVRLDESQNSQLQRKQVPQRSISQRSGTGIRQFSRPTVLQGTIEADNKRRPGVLMRNASKYDPPSPEPPDPNSEAKSVTIRRMQSSLEEWDKQLQEICQKKVTNDTIQRSELEQREVDIKDLTERYTAECNLKSQLEQERNQLIQQLGSTETELVDHQQQVDQLQSDLAQYEVAYQQLEARRNELEQEVVSVTEQLEQSETMRRRLNDHVTELQGQLAIEEQRSRFCVLM